MAAVRQRSPRQVPELEKSSLYVANLLTCSVDRVSITRLVLYVWCRHARQDAASCYPAPISEALPSCAHEVLPNTTLERNLLTICRFLETHQSIFLALPAPVPP